MGGLRRENILSESSSKWGGGVPQRLPVHIVNNSRSSTGRLVLAVHLALSVPTAGSGAACEPFAGLSQESQAEARIVVGVGDRALLHPMK